MITRSLVLYFSLCFGCVLNAVQVGDLRCEFLKSPEGIDVTQPRLSWVLQNSEAEAQVRGQKQTAYQLLAASTAEQLASNSGDLWDTGKIESGDSINVRYGGKELKSQDRCFWKVRVWDKDGHASDWSKPTQWSMGLLAPSDWQAKWIGLDQAAVKPQGLDGAQWIWYPEGEAATAAPVGTRSFERWINLPAGREIRSAAAWMTADNEAEFFVNGARAGAANNFHAVTLMDITGMLHAGTNRVVVVARNAGESPNPAGMLALIRIDFAKGEPLIIGTDSQWRAAMSAEASALFDKPAKVLGPVGMGPWGKVQLTDNTRRLPARWLRKEFDAAKPIRRATVTYSGLGWSELYINGKRIGDEVLSPALSDYSKRVFYITHDVTAAVQKGNNAIGVVLGNGRYFAPRLSDPTETLTYGFPKLLLQLRIDYDDGSTTTVISDESWKLATDGPIRANNEYDGEDYDARKELPGWALPGCAEAGWRGAEVVPAPAGRLVSPMINPIRVTGEIKPVSVSQPTPGVFVFDMGQNFAGWCRLRVKGEAGAAVRLRHAERLRNDGTLYVDNLRGAKVTDLYVLRGEGEEVYEPRFTLHGFQYVEVTGYPGTPTLESITGRVVNDDLESAGEFECSNPLLNRIYKNIVWGVRGNYRSIPTDCPQRDERQGWLGDRSAESRGEGYMFQHGSLYAKWVRDMVDSQRQDGVVSDVCPNYWPMYNDSITWPGSIAIIPAALLDLYDDRDLIEKEYPAISKWLDHHINLIKNNLSTRDTYGDWCVPPEDPKLIHSNDPARKTAGPIIATCYLRHCLQLGARYATLLGKTEDAKRFAEFSERLVSGLNAKFYSNEKGFYDNGSAASCILPLAFDLAPREQKSNILDRLVTKIGKENGGHSCFGLIGGQWVYRVLSRNGQSELAYEMASKSDYPSLGYMAGKGATTIWELWNGDTADPAMNSGNHVMLVGDLVVWFYEDLAGIAPEASRPGFRNIIMKPTPVSGLQNVRATHYSPYGRISSQWQKRDDSFSWQIAIPPNAKATLYIPTKDGQVQESGKPAAEAAGLRLVRVDPGQAIYHADAGSYSFTSRMP